MRIGLVIYGSLTTLTGGYLYDRILVDYLTSHGHSVRVFSLNFRGYPGNLLHNISFSFLKSLAQAELDIVIQDELNHPSLFWLNRKLKKRTSYPVISIVHHLRCSELRPSWQNALYRYVERAYLSTLDGFVFNSRTTRTSVENLLGTSVPSVIAYPGCDRVRPSISADEIRRRAIQEGPLQVLFVGSLIPRKELHTLVAALGLLQDYLVRLDVVGSPDTDPRYAASVRKKIRNLGLESRISLHGTVTGAKLEQLYAHSHVLAVPSSYEGFGIVYLEGMGFGLPAIAGNVGAAHEIVTHGETGFLLKPGDAQSLAAVLEDLAQNRDRLADMGVAAQKRFSEHPTWEQSCEKIMVFLNNMVK